mmetsp:Transcript_28062/g.78258  ORF Transcript_28062/g.78258 Transcript_28062/m.78258 type:complete len:187 (+) Transcript_28062:634-1194(+)|eukprot:scaffold134902_cov31-Tisochrysis_lutea.AAC.4
MIFTPRPGFATQVWRITPRRIDAGQVRGKWAGRVAPAHPSTEAATLRHDAAGLLSVKRGGGSFDFGITTAADPSADNDDIVIGRVIEGGEVRPTCRRIAKASTHFARVAEGALLSSHLTRDESTWMPLLASQVVAAMGALPVVSVPGQGEGMASSREKACTYGGTNSFCAQAKPLKKLQLARARML